MRGCLITCIGGNHYVSCTGIYVRLTRDITFNVAWLVGRTVPPHPPPPAARVCAFAAKRHRSLPPPSRPRQACDRFSLQSTDLGALGEFWLGPHLISIVHLGVGAPHLPRPTHHQRVNVIQPNKCLHLIFTIINILLGV